ncbi:MAG: SPOR domain-containing protein [bacterium]|nr:SPOR domain-containing protein [Candidatus Kapabacteria bacterium]
MRPESSSDQATESSDQATEPSQMQFPRPDEIADLDRPIVMPPRRSNGARIALAAVIVVGLVVAIGAYVGGGEIISDLFDDSAATPVAVPESATVLFDSSESTTDSIARTEQMAVFGERPGDTITRAPFGSGQVAARATQRPAGNDSVVPGSFKRVVVQHPATAVAAKSVQQPVAVTASKPAAPSTRFIIQVKATPSRAEADAMSAKLRAGGARGVTVTSAQANGKTVYRVRYGTFNSTEAARIAAAQQGYPNAWIVRQ